MVRSLRIGHRRFVLSPGVNTVGREPKCTVCINDASVSRGHARITIKGTDVILEDLGSKNGTQVMGVLLKAPTALKDGDEVEAKITTIDRKNRKISLSVRAKDMEEENEAVHEYARKGGSATSSLGDKLKEKLGGHESSDS